MVKSRKVAWTITKTGGAATPFEAKQDAFKYMLFEHLDAPNTMPSGSCVSWDDDQPCRAHGANVFWRREQ